MKKIDESQVKEAVLAAKNLSAVRELRFAEMTAPIDPRNQFIRNAHRRSVDHLFVDHSSKPQIDLDRFERIYAQSQSEMKHLYEERRVEAIKNSTIEAKNFSHQIQSRRKAIETLQAAKFKPVVINIDSPFLIWATPASNLIESHIEPFNSRAKFFFKSGARSGVKELSFYYLWTNPTDQFTVINVDGYLALNGYCQAGQDGGFFPGDRITNVNLATTMLPFEWWNQPPTSPIFQTSQSQTVLDFSASGGGGFGDVGAIESRRISRASGMGYELFLIPPYGVTVMEYSLIVRYASGDDGGGNVLVDFDSGDFNVMSPFVTIQILT